jgi:Brp/Blh family beta-carotene 15,15'-monooxygenase
VTNVERQARELSLPSCSTPAGALPVAAAWSRWLVLGVVLVVGGQVIGLPSLPSSAVLVISALGFLAGLPHGGVDHLMAVRLAGNRSLVQVVIAYAGLVVVTWALLQWAGPMALVAVVALSALHFGLGELEMARELTGWRPGGGTAVALVVAGTGALVLPLARSGDQFRSVATAVSPGLAEVIGASPVRIGLFAAWLVAALVAVLSSVLAEHFWVALDVVLIGALGLLLPPLLAFAVWFGGWHALRHSARMLTTEPGSAALLDRGRGRSAVLHLAKLAALPSIAALTAVIALGWFTVTAPDSTMVMAEVLRVILALTVPHMVVVLWLDRTRGLPGR